MTLYRLLMKLAKAFKYQLRKQRDKILHLQREVFFPHGIQRFLLDGSVVAMSNGRRKKEGAERIT